MKVQDYSSRPTIHCNAGNDQSRVVMMFADAVEKYGRRLKDENLGLAYHRTRLAFRDQQQINFVVLKDLPRPTIGDQTK